jgi:hypothetical protein
VVVWLRALAVHGNHVGLVNFPVVDALFAVG